MPTRLPSALRARTSRTATRSFKVVALTAFALGATLAGCVAEEGPLAPSGAATMRPSADIEIIDSGGGGDGQVGTRLLVCPTNETQSATAEIGPSGGELALGATRLSIPAGAVIEPTTFVLTIPAGPYVEVEAHAVGVEHYEFHRPVSVSIDYSRCPENRAQLHAWYIDTNSKTLLEAMGGVTDTTARTHTFETPHLSGYAVAN